LNEEFLKPGGWVTTNIESGEQWDAPNGWAPLQWICFQGLQQYQFDELAEEGAKRWLTTLDLVFSNTGKMLEKYNVVTPGEIAGGGEYAVQDGFGWTNGTYLALKRAIET
jgi:alpha,alpha-trehalase